MPDLAQDPRGSGRPDKRARVLIVLAKVLTNGSNEFSHAAKRSTPNALARDLREPALHQVQPRGPRGDEMEMVALALSEPLLHLGMFVRAVVVHDQMNLPPTRSLPIDALHKVQKLLMPMSRQAATDDGALQDIERGEQRRRAVTDVVVSLTSRESGAHGQRGLRTVESLDLTLLVNAQHQGLVRRVQVQPDHIAQLPHEVGVAAQLERLRSVWLQTVSFPDAVDRGGTHPVRTRHRAHAPMRRVAWPSLQRGVHDRFHLRRSNLLPPARSRRILQQPGKARLRIALSPEKDRWPAGVELLGQAMVRLPLRGRQHDPRAHRDLLRRVPTTNQRLEKLAILGTNRQCFGCVPHRAARVA